MTSTRRQKVTEPITCSFCNRAERQVRRLIAGPKVFICDQCVDVCVDIIAEDEEAPSAFETLSADVTEIVNCSLCKMSTTADECDAIPDRGWLCCVCIDIIRLATDPDNEVEEDGAT